MAHPDTDPEDTMTITPALAANVSAHLRRAAALPCPCPPNVQCPAAPADPAAPAYCEACGRTITEIPASRAGICDTCGAEDPSGTCCLVTITCSNPLGHGAHRPSARTICTGRNDDAPLAYDEACGACGADVGEPCRPGCLGEAAHLDANT